MAGGSRNPTPWQFLEHPFNALGALLLALSLAGQLLERISCLLTNHGVGRRLLERTSCLLTNHGIGRWLHHLQ